MSGFIPSELGLLTKLTYNLCARPAQLHQLRTASARLLHISLLLHLRGVQERLKATCMHWQVVR